MSFKIEIHIENTVIHAELNNSPTAGEIRQALPLEVSMTRWGDEYYGECNVRAELSADAKEIMEIGEIAFWPPGNAFCFFFGPTPASTDDRPRAASPVNPVGMIKGDTDVLKSMGNSIKVKIIK